MVSRQPSRYERAGTQVCAIRDRCTDRWLRLGSEFASVGRANIYNSVGSKFQL